MVELHETEVDGVRCFWVETGRPTLAAKLAFRQGMADEWLTESGWLHMLEHLALHGRGGGRLQVNGSTSLLHTEFDAHGPAELVVEHLAGLTAWLAEPVFHEFERERGVLEAESRLRADNVSRRALGWRYGSIGPGTAAYGEPGIARSTPESLRAKARWAFTAGNAALVLDGPPPPGLRLDLPAGELRRPPRAIPCGDTLPAAYQDEAGLVVSGVVRRDPAAVFAPTLIERALRARLRDQAGAAYAPFALYEPVDDERAVVVGGSDVLPTLLPDLVDIALDTVRQLAVMGPSPDELETLRHEHHQALHDPYSAVGLAVQAAYAHLRTDSPRTFTDLVDELLTVGDKAVKESLREFWESLMIGLPGAAGWRDQVPTLEFPAGPPVVQGRAFRHRDWPATAAQLVVGPAGVELRTGDVAHTILFEDATGVFGYGDGSHRVISHEGWPIEVVAADWSHGDHAVLDLRRYAPAQLHLQLGPESRQERGARMGAVQRWAQGARRARRRLR